MIGPSWLADVFAAVVIVVALFSAARLTASRGRRRRGEVDADGVHVLMGVAMAGMFVPRLATWPTPAWEAIFAVSAVWFGWRTVRVRRASVAGPGDEPGRLVYAGHCCPYPAPHLIDCVAMLYALWAVPVIWPADGAGSMSGMAGAAGGARLPVLGLILALLICGYVVWLGDRVQLLSPALAAGVVPAGDLVGSASAAGGPVSGQAGLRAAGAPSETGAVAGPSVPGGSAAAVIARKVADSSPGRPLLAPRAATCCKIAMGVAMTLMLVDLL